MEKVILRREFNCYTKQWGYLACFPDDEANPGRIGAIAFHFDQYNQAVFEPYCEIDLRYMYAKKIIHKDEPDVEKCIKALSDMYHTDFRVCEKITKK